MKNIDLHFYPEWTRKSISFTIDDGNVVLDRKFLDITEPAGLKGTFNLTTPLKRLTPEEYRQFYRGDFTHLDFDYDHTPEEIEIAKQASYEAVKQYYLPSKPLSYTDKRFRYLELLAGFLRLLLIDCKYLYAAFYLIAHLVKVS